MVRLYYLMQLLGTVSVVKRSKILEVTLNALRTRQSLVKGERLVRHEMRAVLHDAHHMNPIELALGF